jgi:hypothetical protein
MKQFGVLGRPVTPLSRSLSRNPINPLGMTRNELSE